jgi:radical SAM protein with 4Fe4S-binding SPASM domain
LKKLGLLISINTNGSLLDDSMIRHLAKDPPLRMNISLYGSSDESYQRLCGQPSYEKVANNIRALREAGIQVRINSTITPYNGQDIEGIYRFARENELRIKATSYMFPPVRINDCRYGDAPHRFGPEEAAEKLLFCREQYLTAEQLANSWVGDPCGDTECSDGQGDPMGCRAGKTAFWITWDGRMLPCGMFPGEGYSVAQIGFKPAWEAVRRDCAALRLPAKCSSCGYRKICPACAASCLTECGNLEQPPEYICRMTKHLDWITREKYGREESDVESK